MALYVLIPGAMHGGWCWQRLTGFLTSQGHRVYTPSYTGMGERKHFCYFVARLDPEDIVDLLEYEDLEQAILVGHSYGGLVLNGVAQKAFARLKRLVYLAAFIGEHGKSLLDLQPPATVEYYLKTAREKGEGWYLPPVPELMDRWGLIAPEDRRWVLSKLTPFPLKCFKDKLDLPGCLAEKLPRTYIECTGEPMRGILKHFAERARRENWQVIEIDASHEPMITHPQELAKALLSLA